MINLLKPGHILRFATCPGGIVSPSAAATAGQDNTLETLWPTTSNLGAVQAYSHPSGPIGPIAADVAKRLRTGFKLSRVASYSSLGRAKTPANRLVGAENCHFVGYTDGKAHYINSASTVFSKDFSGCTMVAYTQGGVRRVAHAAASGVAAMNCRHAFMTTIQANGAVLIGWFKPFTAAADNGRKVAAYGAIGQHFGNNINKLTSFGVITAGNVPYSLDAFKPVGVGFGANDWVVTYVGPRALSGAWVVP
jgi:hypothetical protein